jgi:serine phosphatase RsbU (regulator of sigma subunit)
MQGGIEYRPYVPADHPPEGDAMSPQQMAQILWLIEQVGKHIDLDQTLDAVCEHIRPLLACNRIGLALLKGDQVVSRWVKSDRPVRLKVGFTGSLKGSTLQRVLERREARIINDLQQYLRENPQSVSTRLLVEEGLASSLTCPLLVKDEAVGFLFFTSDKPNAYSGAALPFYHHVAAQLSLVIEKARLYSDLATYAQAVRDHNDRMQHELDLARHVQRMLVPTAPPQAPGLDIALWYQPVQQVGGDLVEFAVLPDGSLLVFMADAMGHGVQAALVMTMLKGMVASFIRSGVAMPDLLPELNKAVMPLLQDYFAVALCAEINAAAGRLRVARAGIPPLLLRPRGGSVAALADGGLPLGIGEESYPIEETAIGPGDSILLATDGLCESMNCNGEQFGTDCLAKAFAAAGDVPPQQTIDAILRKRESFCGNWPQEDDVSLLVIRRR